MNELASMTIGRRQVRSIDEKKDEFFERDYSQNSQTLNYHQIPINLHRGPSYPVNHQEYYKYPPALPPGYQPLTSDSASTSGIFGISLVDALSSISQYDDLKCVPRIICEVATGVIPGNNQHKQSYTTSGMNALISFLTTVGSSDASPLLNFGKPALMGYANRGNPGICYRQYSKCPRNPNELVNYLNNHNGGFFRFFNTNYHRVNINNKVLTSSYNFVSNRKGTGELKFDTTTPSLKSKILNEDKNDKLIKFPDNHRYFNRLIKSFDYDYESNYRAMEENPIIFPQDRMDQNTADQFYYLNQTDLSNEQQNSYNESQTSEAKIYLYNNIPNQNQKSFTFPDGQSSITDIDSSELFNEDYKKMLKRGVINNHVPQPINFEGLKVINLLELYTEDDTTQYVQVIHPCDMICHDSRGITIQFNQIVNSRGTLSTIMTPERPIVDLSQSLPCQVICINPNGERRKLSTTLSKALRTNHHDEKYKADKSVIRFKRAPSRNKIIKPRFIGDIQMRGGLKLSQYRNLPQMDLSIDSPSISFFGNQESRQSGAGISNYQMQSIYPMSGKMPLIPMPEDDEKFSLDDVATGENPLAFGITIEPTASDLSPLSNDITPIPATVIMCGGSVFFIPVNSERMPVCTKTESIDQDFFDKINETDYLTRNNSDIFMRNETEYFIQNQTNYFVPNESTTVHFPAVEDIMFTQPTISPPTPPSIVTIAREETVQTSELPISNQQPEIFEYQEQSSCLEGESWDSTDHQCVPVKYHKDAEYDYSDVTGITWDKIPTKKRDGNNPKIIIMTPEAGMLVGDTISMKYARPVSHPSDGDATSWKIGWISTVE
ncbi:hypothetical protein PV327_002774 [Microctonus hyperodae]|uniref:Uncharacterized protein n=1 Tax=Microctonus hyperodae TaxID=165561 RepID=A0AA39FGE6_MICHY|nr:hypothetical protein PV327_002774 [Microctonus hyperodae]